MYMQDDLERSTEHGNDRLAEGMERSQVQYREREVKPNIGSFLEAAAVILEPLKTAIWTADMTKV